MLQQILKDMYIEPEVLDALNDEQKKILFLKMREEQVRRWKEWQEKLEKEGGDKRAKPKKANSKSVSWLPGRDGDVSVIVIGEVDELTSKFICAGFVEKKSPTVQDNIPLQTILKSKNIKEVKTESSSSKTQTPNFKQESCKEACSSLTLPVSAGERSPSTEPQKASSSVEEQPSSRSSACSRPHTHSSSVPVRQASLPTLSCVRMTATLAASPSPSSSSVKGTSAAASLLKEPSKGTSVLEKFRAADTEEAWKSGKAVTRSGHSRVSELKKAFSVEPQVQNGPRSSKPPLPSKPSHLSSTPTVR